MSPNHACWRRLAAGMIVCAYALISPAAFAQTDTVSSLSGFAYFDANLNGLPNPTDWAIMDAKITLFKQDDATFTPYSVYTDAKGYYWFDGTSPQDHSGLPVGTYTIRLDTSSVLHGTNSVGTLWDMSLNLPLSQTEQTAYQGYSLTSNSQGDEFTNIYLPEDTKGTDYNFGENSYPIQLVSKRLLLTSSDPVEHYTGTNVVPEPGTLILLAVGALLGGCLMLSRRRRAANLK
jgi:hypothetical protein